MAAATRTWFETESWPVIRARHFTKVSGPRHVRVIVIHSMEAPEKGTTAESVARYFQTTDRPASAHLCIDADSTIQSVYDNNVAYAAPGCNHDGLQIELAGYARQTNREWLDDYGVQLLDRAANACAQYCLKFDIPVIHLDNGELKSGMKGIVGHNQVSEVYRKSSHTDPGQGFPWSYFVDLTDKWKVKWIKSR